MIKEFLLQLILFSIIEGILLDYFLIKIYNYKSMGYKNILLYSIGITIIYFIFPPILRQIVIILFSSYFIFIIFKDNYIKKFKIIMLFCLNIMLVELICAMIYEYIFGIDYATLNKINTFIIMIPIRFVEILSIKKEVLTWVLGGSEVSKKNQK